MDAPAEYEESATGMWLNVDCPKDGRFSEKVERDTDFFKWDYEQKYEQLVGHCVMNTSLSQPPDRSASALREIFKRESVNITLLGGESTLRPDLFHLIETAKDAHDARDEESSEVYARKLRAREDCSELKLPIRLVRTIDNLGQLDSLLELIHSYRRTINNAPIRSAQPFSIDMPARQVFVSDSISYLGKTGAFTKGASPFNRFIQLSRKPVKICSWVNDVSRVDPVDSDYLISTGEITKFHRGMKLDELRLKGGERAPVSAGASFSNPVEL